jgi:GH35 family endo-1,4-beta-xylanase
MKRLLLLLLCLGALLLIGWQRTARPTARIGVHTVQGNAREAALAHAAGFDTLVQLFHWGEIEPTEGQFFWQQPDELVAAAHYYGLDLVVRLDHPPAWARPTPLVAGQPPVRLDRYAEWVGRVASRYRGQVVAYIIWNEPNLALEWGGLPPDAAAYAQLLEVAYRAVKASDPQALVVSAGLAPTNTANADALDDRRYLAELYAAGAADSFDVLGIHAYGFGLPPATPIDGGWNDGLQGLVLARVAALRTIMEEYGDSAKAAWITEMGWTVTAEAHSAWHAVSEDEQATYLVQALEQRLAEWPWIELMTIWNIDSDPASVWRGYSIVDAAGQPRPAYNALRDHLRPTVAARRRATTEDQGVTEQIQILAADTVIHLGDANLPAPWLPLHRNRNPSPVWEGTFYLPAALLSPPEMAAAPNWQLTMRTMQSNYWGNRIWINDVPLASPLASADFSKSWVTQQWSVPEALLQPGANQIRVTVTHAVPLIQDRRFGYDKLQFKDIGLRRQMRERKLGSRSVP